MNTQLLEYIIAIAEEKSLTKAADRLLLTQSALSQQLKKLEKELGTKLFMRSKNEMILTDAGKIYVNNARSVLGIYYNALENIRNLRLSGRKEIKIVYNNTLLPHFAQEVIPQFSSIYHDIFISTINGNASVSKDYLNTGITDIAVVATNELSHSMLEYIPVRKEEMLLVLREDHPCVSIFREDGVNLALLDKEAFIVNEAGSHMLTMEKEIFHNYQFVPQRIYEISDLDTAKHMVLNQEGITFLPRYMMQEKDGLVSFSLTPPAYFHIVIAYHKSITLSRPVKDLIKLILESSDGETVDE
ncbi:MAG: LysR family transcriptional regulator [Clostridiales bacterium]|nr:LysR family transcriptional regulator [Clostridiales bacterium]